MARLNKLIPNLYWIMTHHLPDMEKKHVFFTPKSPKVDWPCLHPLFQKSFWESKQARTRFKRPCGSLHHQRLPCLFPFQILPAPLGSQTCNVDTVKRERRSTAVHGAGLRLMKLQSRGLSHQQNEARSTWGLSTSIMIRLLRAMAHRATLGHVWWKLCT